MNPAESSAHPLQFFTPEVRLWFERTFGGLTAPQAQGYPAIQRGEHTLILAPTGSGKTLAAFMWAIDELLREAQSGDPSAGVRLVYISPLKALNTDIQRNLMAPLEGIRRCAVELGRPAPEIAVAVRSGDTSSSERRLMLKKPPHILITTPESLYLLLTSPRARGIFQRTVTVIVDEIHTMVGTKRGAHLSLSLERLERLADRRIQRIGLSATIRPLSEAARFLGGSENKEEEKRPDGTALLTARPVTVVDAHGRKELDLKVISALDDWREPPGVSVWPAITSRVLEEVKQHRTTLIFCNNRRLAERAADWLNEANAASKPETESEPAAGKTHDGPFRAHHGSISKEMRRQIEQELKDGKLPALVATSSLELGIDIGAIDLVIQLQSPKSVAQGLQRIGRSGHLVGQTSVGRIYPSFRAEVLEAAAVAGGMLRGEVEETYSPRSPLDVLAQQLVAMVAMEDWATADLYTLVKQAYPFQQLTRPLFDSVLDMLSGRWDAPDVHRLLKPRLVWDRLNDRLSPLPGAAMAAVGNAGVIPDRGVYGAYLQDGKTKLGELDEEFVFETRLGDVFLLGSQVWRVVEITDDRVMVQEAPGMIPHMPFWHGDFPWRPYELGKRLGTLRRMLAERVMALAGSRAGLTQLHDESRAASAGKLLTWLERDFALDETAAWQAVDAVAEQLHSAGAIASDRQVIVEQFEDALGEPQLVIHSPFGGRINGAWGLVLASALREQAGTSAEMQVNDDGLLIRWSLGQDISPGELLRRIGPAEARERLLAELPHSALFGAQFRQNAARALLLPGLKPGRRTPLWLQRLRAKDLLQAVQGFGDFPLLIETYRECLENLLDLPHLQEVLQGIQDGRIEILTMESLTPSPVARGLVMQFTGIYLYEGDVPRAEHQLQQLTINRELLQQALKGVSLAGLLKPEAIAEVEHQQQHTAPQARARTAEELAFIFQQLGDLADEEIPPRAAGDPQPWLSQLLAQGRLVRMQIPEASRSPERLISAELAGQYALALGAMPSAASDQGAEAIHTARQAILRRFLRNSGPVSVIQIHARYPFPAEWLNGELASLVESGELAQGRFSAEGTGDEQYLERGNLEQIHRRTLSLLRREVQPVSRFIYADFLARWQHLYPGRRLAGSGGLTLALQQLRAMPVSAHAWEEAVLPARLEAYQPAELEKMCRDGEVIWLAEGGSDPRRSRVSFFFRGEGRQFLEPAPVQLSALSAEARAAYTFLKAEGPLGFAELAGALRQTAPSLQKSLLELALHGLITADRLEAMRRLASLAPEAEEAAHSYEESSSLGRDLAEWRAGQQPLSGGLRRLRPSDYRAAKRRINRMLASPPQEKEMWPGRWSIMHRFGLLGAELSPEEIAVRQARQLLQRWGVVTHAVMEAEPGGWNWEAIYAQLRLMEMRGEVRRGYFIEGWPGAQFSLPEVVEELRALRQAQPEEAEMLLMNACDPANTHSGLFNLPAASEQMQAAISRLPSNWLVQFRGEPLLLAEGNGVSLSAAKDLEGELLLRALKTLLKGLPLNQYRLTIRNWNGQPIMGSAVQPLLESLGCRRDYSGLTLEK